MGISKGDTEGISWDMIYNGDKQLDMISKTFRENLGGSWRCKHQR